MWGGICSVRALAATAMQTSSLDGFVYHLVLPAGFVLQGRRPARGKRGQGTGSCQADDCSADLSKSSWHERKRTCPQHAQAKEFLKKECPSRFCQQCSRVHLIEAFEKDRRSCKEQLAKHAARWAFELAIACRKTASHDAVQWAVLCSTVWHLMEGVSHLDWSECPKRTERLKHLSCHHLVAEGGRHMLRRCQRLLP